MISNPTRTDTDSQPKGRRKVNLTGYRIHLSFHQSNSDSNFQLQRDLFQPLPFHRPALNPREIQELNQNPKSGLQTQPLENKSGLSNRKRGKSVASNTRGSASASGSGSGDQPINPQLDPRFGPIKIDWADRTFDQRLEETDHQDSKERSDCESIRMNTSSISSLNANSTSPRLQPFTTPIAKFIKKSSFQIPDSDRNGKDPRESFKTGGTEVSFGIVHLFKDLDQLRNLERLQRSRDENAIDFDRNLSEKDFPPLERNRGKRNSISNQDQASTSTLNSSNSATDAVYQTPSAPCTSSSQVQEEPVTLESDDSGCILAVLAVPALMSASDFLAFVEPALDAISHLRMLREPQPNRCLVLIKFRDSRDAEEFHKLYDGELFNAMNPNEVAKIVYITEVTMSYHSNLPFSFPGGKGANGWPVFPNLSSAFNLASQCDSNHQNKESVSISEREKSLLKESLSQELPTCPVCLERMDENVSGLMTVACQHTFHCNCLSKWSDGRCPVCRYSQSRQISTPRPSQNSAGPSTSNQDGNQDQVAATCCTICKTSSDLWVCLICATVGCGRYKEGHAKEHYVQTRHLYSLELETQRVWDYAGDNYVHRLIQNRADGKLVELPSSSSQLSNLNADGVSNDSNGVSNALHSEKVEAIALEYSNLLTSQLESQRSFYESQLKQMEMKVDQLKIEKEEETIKSRQIESQKNDILNQLIELKESNRKNEELKEKQDKKLEKSVELIRKLNSDLESERSVTKGLMRNLDKVKEREGKIQSELAEVKEQVKDLMMFLSARDQIEKNGEGVGGDVSIGSSSGGKRKGKKK